jgi:hypothetical protein
MARMQALEDGRFDEMKKSSYALHCVEVASPQGG